MPENWLFILLSFVLFCALALGLGFMVMYGARRGVKKQQEMDIEEQKKLPP